VKVFNPLAKCYVSMEKKRCYECNENEKKRQYNARVLQIEHGSFTPFRQPAHMIADKRSSSPQITSWVNRKISFSLMRTLHMCVRGSRTIYRKDASVLSIVAPDVSEFGASI